MGKEVNASDVRIRHSGIPWVWLLKAIEFIEKNPESSGYKLSKSFKEEYDYNISRMTFPRIQNKMDGKYKIGYLLYDKIKNEYPKIYKFILDHNGIDLKKYENFLNDLAKEIEKELIDKNFKKFEEDKIITDEVLNDLKKIVNKEDLIWVLDIHEKIYKSKLSAKSFSLRLKAFLFLKKYPNVSIKDASLLFNLSKSTIDRLKKHKTVPEKFYNNLDTIINEIGEDNVWNLSFEDLEEEYHFKIRLPKLTRKQLLKISNSNDALLKICLKPERIKNLKEKFFIFLEKDKKRSKKDPKKNTNENDSNNQNHSKEKTPKLVRITLAGSKRRFDKNIEDLKPSMEKFKKRKSIHIHAWENSSDTIKKLAMNFGSEIKELSGFSEKYFDKIIENSKFSKTKTELLVKDE